MKLTITATLTEEEVTTLAVAKGRKEINEKTPEEYVSSIYQNIVVSDMSNIFTKIALEELRQQMAETTNSVKATVGSNVVSSIENE